MTTPPPINPIQAMTAFQQFQQHFAETVIAKGVSKEVLVKELELAVRGACQMTGYFSTPGQGIASASQRVGVHHSAEVLGHHLTRLLGQSAARGAIGAGGSAAGAALPALIVGVAFIMLAAAVAFHFAKQMEENRHRREKMEELERQHLKAQKLLEEIRNETLHDPMKFIRMPRNAGG